MLEIKGLKNGKAEYFDNEEGMKEFLEMNKDVLEPYLERMCFAFELTDYDLNEETEPTTISDKYGYINCLDPLVKEEYSYKGNIESIIVNDIGTSKDFEEYGNDNSFFIYELSAEIYGIMYSSLIDRLGKIHYWNPDWDTIKVEEVTELFIERE